MFDSIRFNGYKSFSQDETSEVLDIGYINLFIGKNNCGKSSVIDVAGSMCDAEAYRKLTTKPMLINAGFKITPELIDNTYGNTTLKRKAETYLGSTIWASLIAKNYSSYTRFDYEYTRELNNNIFGTEQLWLDCSRKIVKPEYTYVKIAADRDIIPEVANQNIELLADGTGATNLIRSVINNKKYDEHLIEVDLLNALNEIMGADAHFERIMVQEGVAGTQGSEPQWEIYLQESGSKRFPLSQTGSGLKTIVIVLLQLLVLPQLPSAKNYVYGFEELENNLHPALQRRLFEYIYKFAVENKKYIFLTTHSHVAINMFFNKTDAAIYHVVKENQRSTIKKIDNYLDKVEILDDLDVQASDLLQANGVIWVEGPSDRIYIKKWLEVFGGNDITEGTDFQFVYYGGRLLSNYTAEEQEGLINLLLVNRNSAIVMDSDKTSRQCKINDTKKRIEKEFQDKCLFSWITSGKEIENYISLSALESSLKTVPEKQCGQYDLFPNYIEKHYKNFSNKKVPFANQVKDSLNDENVLDLQKQIKKLYGEIKSWSK